MNIWKRLIAFFRGKTAADDPAPSSRREALDEQARNAARVADARLPPHSGTLNF